jgi:lysyl-tRNA synthetase class II
VGAVHSILRHQVAPRTRGLLIVEGLPQGRSPLSYAQGGTYSRAWLFVNGISVADVAVEDPSLDVVRGNLGAQFRHERYAVERDYRAFLETLALGMPPCIGMGMSLSRVLQASMGFSSIRETRLPCQGGRL